MRRRKKAVAIVAKRQYRARPRKARRPKRARRILMRACRKCERRDDGGASVFELQRRPPLLLCFSCGFEVMEAWVERSLIRRGRRQ